MYIAKLLKVAVEWIDNVDIVAIAVVGLPSPFFIITTITELKFNLTSYRVQVRVINHTTSKI
jgi:hypothetical protein